MKRCRRSNRSAGHSWYRLPRQGRWHRCHLVTGGALALTDTGKSIIGASADSSQTSRAAAGSGSADGPGSAGATISRGSDRLCVGRLIGACEVQCPRGDIDGAALGIATRAAGSAGPAVAAVAAFAVGAAAAAVTTGARRAGAVAAFSAGPASKSVASSAGEQTVRAVAAAAAGAPSWSSRWRA